MQEPALAHIRISPAGARLDHLLSDHSQAVSGLAAGFAASFGPQWAGLAGLWHDLGKFRIGFQRYIRGVNGIDAHLEGRWPTGSEKTHSAAGALHAGQAFEERFGPGVGQLFSRVLAYVIAGHHAGLADWTAGLDDRLLGSRGPDSQREYEQALAACRAEAPDLLALPQAFNQQTLAGIPIARSPHPLAWALWIRMLFSALVDADFLDTEAFMQPEQARRREGALPLSHHLDALTTHLDAKAAQVRAQGRHDDPVMQARRTVLQQCRSKATLPPGVFSLTVPTGGGKTLSSLAFALQHAVTHSKQRVIYAIPYTSIIEQTADVFKGIFGDDQVIEHHSQADTDERDETPRSRLACENWDAPLIVTTNVQLFESLFAAKTSRCRKLHNIAGSVIVLDEAQLLPPEFLQPILDALHVLVAHFGVTLLLCTATQPTLTSSQRFDPRQNLRGLPAPTRIIDNEAELFEQLRRVDIHWPSDLHTPEATHTLVARVAPHDCVLVIVNTRNDAAELMRALNAATGDTCLHLSAAMCGQHRADVIREIRHRLAARRAGTDARPLRVVSTQLVEAGVDIDFPVVYRALAGLDSIAQAAGRCNREGQLPDGQRGHVSIFVREIPKPLHAVRLGAQATRSVVHAAGDALSPAAFEKYFPLYYADFPSRDKHQIVADLQKSDRLEFQFRSAADKFRLIDDAQQVGVIVPYTSAGAPDIAPLIALLRRGETDRWVLRKLQRYTVTARRKMVEQWQARGDVLELLPGVYLLNDTLRYSHELGLLLDNQQPDAASMVA